MKITAILVASLHLLTSTTALTTKGELANTGIGCSNSLLNIVDCVLGYVDTGLNLNVIETLRDAVYSSSLPDTTRYTNNEPIICISETIKVDIIAGVDAKCPNPVTLALKKSLLLPLGAFCVSLSGAKSVITLAEIKKLIDALLGYGCSQCGLIPITYLSVPPINDILQGCLKIDFVIGGTCTGNCIHHY